MRTRVRVPAVLALGSASVPPPAMVRPRVNAVLVPAIAPLTVRAEPAFTLTNASVFDGDAKSRLLEMASVAALARIAPPRETMSGKAVPPAPVLIVALLLNSTPATVTALVPVPRFRLVLVLV